MKHLKITILLSLLLVLVVSCGKVKNVLVSQDGKWLSSAVTTRSYVNSTLDSTWTTQNPTTYTFDKAGTVVVTPTTGSSQTLTWTVNQNQDIISLCVSSPTYSCTEYLIVSSSKSEQQWKATIVGAVNGEWTEQDLTLTRQ